MIRKSLIATLALAGALALSAVAWADDKPPAFAACLEGGSPSALLDSRDKAEKVVRACAEAIQSRTLSPADLALARLTRGAARTALGDRVLAAGDYLEALRHYEGAIDPANPAALELYRAAAALDGVGKSEAALRKYGEAIQADPKLALAYYGRGILLATRERAYSRAVGDFDRVLALEPTNVGALLRRGDAHSQLGNAGYAIADLNRAIELDPTNPRGYVMRGLANFRRGQAALALDDFAAALKIHPCDVDALRNRGALYATYGRLDEAIRDFNAVIALQPRDALTFFNRGYAYFGKQAYDLAVIDYGTAIYLDPAMGGAYLNRGLIRTIQGKDLVEALADCDQALKLMPLSVAVRETRGFIFLKLGDPALAITEYEAALQVDANRPLALYGRGLARIRMGRKAEGQADQAAALVLNPAIDSEFSIYGVR